MVFFCGSYPNHALDVPTGDDAATKLRDIIDSFNDKNSGKNKAYEIKLTAVVYQNVPNDHLTMMQLMSQPQTMNYSSDFNLGATDEMLEAQRILRSKGFNANFSVTAIDGVSCDSGYVKNQLRGLLGVKPESAHIVANHNARNVR